MKKITFYFLALFVLSYGCNNSNKSTLNGLVSTADEGVMYELEQATPAKKDLETVDAQKDFQQKIIKTGHFTFETKSVASTFNDIKRWVASHKGFIQHDNTRKEYDRIYRSLTIRIPSDKFQPIVDSIYNTAHSLDRREIVLQDVTEEFVDIEARLLAKQKLEERYLQLLSKATTVKDMLEIERQIANIREEIEAQQGRLKFLQNRVSMSTLHLDFYEMVEGEKPPSQTYFSRLWRGMKGGVTAIGDFIIALAYIWPFILAGTLLFIYLRKRYLKRKNRSKS